MDTTGSTTLHIRTARTAPAQQAQDAAMAAALEAICFPPEQAASPTTIAERMASYADHFWLIEDEGGTLLALVNGLCTNEPDLSDEMYESPTMHDPDGVERPRPERQVPPPRRISQAVGKGVWVRVLRHPTPGASVSRPEPRRPPAWPPPGPGPGGRRP